MSRLSRLFIALQPPPGLMTDLLTVQQTLSTPGRPVSASHLHLTLVFLGNILPEQELSLTDNLALLQHPGFDFTLNTLGYFHGPKVLWAGPAATPAPMQQLHAKIRAAVHASGIALPSATFRPHVTLLRKAPHAESALKINSLDWHADQFWLMRSTLTEHGPLYEKRRAFQLT